MLGLPFRGSWLHSSCALLKSTWGLGATAVWNNLFGVQVVSACLQHSRNRADGLMGDFVSVS